MIMIMNMTLMQILWTNQKNQHFIFSTFTSVKIDSNIALDFYNNDDDNNDNNNNNNDNNSDD